MPVIGCSIGCSLVIVSHGEWLAKYGSECVMSYCCHNFYKAKLVTLSVSRMDIVWVDYTWVTLYIVVIHWELQWLQYSILRKIICTGSKADWFFGVKWHYSKCDSFLKGYKARVIVHNMKYLHSNHYMYKRYSLMNHMNVHHTHPISLLHMYTYLTILSNCHSTFNIIFCQQIEHVCVANISY